MNKRHLSDKVALIHYTGSVESYLMLRYVMDNNIKPVLLFLNAKSRNFELFKTPNVYKIIRKIMKDFEIIEINNYKEIEMISSADKQVIRSIYLKLKKLYPNCKYFYFFINDNDFEPLMRKRLKEIIINNSKKMFKISFFLSLTKKIKNNYWNNTKCFPITIHKSITKYKQPKEYLISKIKKDIIKNGNKIKTLITKSEIPKIKLTIKKIKHQDIIDYNIYIPQI
ncbi:MAG: hypothetical protein N2Z20_03340 [Elusimicrobiales bacterium]|nr:hypothetical protein [Elusimicrobiales bacterium]